MPLNFIKNLFAPKEKQTPIKSTPINRAPTSGLNYTPMTFGTNRPLLPVTHPSNLSAMPYNYTQVKTTVKPTAAEKKQQEELAYAEWLAEQAAAQAEYDARNNTTKPTRGTSTSSKAIQTPVVQTPWYYSGDEIARKFGIDNNKDNIYAELLGALNAKFDEFETQTKRAEESARRAMSDNYIQSLQDARVNRANAVQTGMTRGMAAANQMANMLGFQQNNALVQQGAQDVLLDVGQQRGTAAEQARVTASDTQRAIAQYLAQMGATFEANDVNRRAAELQSNATIEAARLQSNATRAAATSADEYLYNMIKQGTAGNPAAKAFTDFKLGSSGLSSYFKHYNNTNK